jgi:methylenetetrahydrofolate reductase (NADPH)
MNIIVSAGEMDAIDPTRKAERPLHFLERATIEVTPHDPAVAADVQAFLPPGTSVHITSLPGVPHDLMIETCSRLQRAGYAPTPHITARSYRDRAALEDVLSALRSRAGVSRALLLAGDVDRPSGAFASSLDVLNTGLLQAYGIRTVLVAGHPEGHPNVGDDELIQALEAKVAYCREHGLTTEIVTQFSFEAGPVLRWLARIRAAGIAVPVRIGVAGPAKTGTLIKYALRCGIGASVQTLMRRPGVVAGLVTTSSPDDLIEDLAANLAPEHGEVAGIHLFVFGGLKATAKWLASARARTGNIGGNT